MSKYIFLKVLDKYPGVEDYWPSKLLGFSFALTFDYDKGFQSWTEPDVKKLTSYINSFSYVVGFNLVDYDLEVLSNYAVLLEEDVEEQAIDIFILVKLKTGVSVSLNELSICTLNQIMDVDGLYCVDLWIAKRIDELIRYLKKELQLIIGLFEFIQENGFLLHYLDGEKTRIAIELPTTADKIEACQLEIKSWLNGYLSSILHSNTITNDQILLLKRKFNELLIRLETKHHIRVSEVTIGVDDTLKKIFGEEQTNRDPPDNSQFDEAAADLPW